MGEMEIRHFSEEEMRKFKEQHDVAEPKEFALIDKELDVVMDFYDTEEQAKASLEKWRILDLVEDSLRECVTKIASEVGIDEAKVTEIAQGFFD